jgi:hypothetical protein
MRKTSHFTDAFVDESIRGQRYLLCCSLVHAQNIPAIRQQIEKSQFKGRRIHFNSANTATRRNFLNLLNNAPTQSLLVVSNINHRTHLFQARHQALAELVSVLQRRKVERLIIESRGDDSDDVRTILTSRSKRERLYFEHRQAKHEPMLWIPDAVAWCYGAGGVWASEIESLVERVIVCSS